MRHKDVERAERLVSKFFDGSTTLAEEKWLYRLMSRSDLPPGLRRYRPLFAAFGSMDAGRRSGKDMAAVFRRSVCASAAALALILGVTLYADYREESMLARAYGGSYVIENGRRIDDLRLIRGDIEEALDEAGRMERQLGTAGFIKSAEQDVLDGIGDADMRRHVEEMLNE